MYQGTLSACRMRNFTYTSVLYTGNLFAPYQHRSLSFIIFMIFISECYLHRDLWWCVIIIISTCHRVWYAWVFMHPTNSGDFSIIMVMVFMSKCCLPWALKAYFLTYQTALYTVSIGDVLSSLYQLVMGSNIHGCFLHHIKSSHFSIIMFMIYMSPFCLYPEQLKHIFIHISNIMWYRVAWAGMTNHFL